MDVSGRTGADASSEESGIRRRNWPGAVPQALVAAGSGTARTVTPEAPWDEGDRPEQTFRLWRVMVWRILKRLGVPSERLEDATQDVFIVAMRRWNGFEHRSSRKTWLGGIAARVGQEHKRDARKKRCNGDFSSVEHTVTQPAWGAKPFRDPHDSTVCSEESRWVDAALSSLPEKHREVFVLMVLEEQTYAEVAEALGSTTKAVERRLHRARAKFERALRRLRARDERRLR